MSLYEVKKTTGDSSWFMHDRFGMFIHFGLYSMPARHEWVKTREFMTNEDYEVYFKHFNPDLFDAREWARQAKAAGMKYAVLTAKHHEGFCLFDSEYTDYKITNTAFGRDLIKEYVEAFRAEGLHVGLYYSLLDWHHPHYTIDTRHPLRNHEEAAELNKTRDFKIYNEYMRNQIRELLTNYGKIDVMWFDFSWRIASAEDSTDPLLRGKDEEDWESEKLLELIRSLQPDILINNRLSSRRNLGDLRTPEQDQPHGWVRDPQTKERAVWEACQTFSGAWGYHRDEHSWKTPRQVLEMLIRTVSFGGNLLMNVGPTARGIFDERATERLEAIGKWMRFHSRSIYGCTQPEECFKAPDGCILTESDDGKRLYVHLLSYPLTYLSLDDLADRIEYAQLMHDGSELAFRKNYKQTGAFTAKTVEGAVTITLPMPPPDDEIPVVEIFLK